MKYAARFRFDVVTPRALTADEKHRLQSELAEWLRSRVMRMGGMLPTRIFLQEQAIPVTSFGSSEQFELTDAGRQALGPSPELQAERERLDGIDIVQDIR